jgi:hypothetical protein
MKIPNLNNILHNRFVLYFFFIFSLILVFYLAFRRDYLTVSVFILVGFITSFFSKNMVVVFLLSLAFTAIVKFAKVKKLEGFTGDSDEDAENEDTVEDTESIKEDMENEDEDESDEETIINKNNKKKKRFAAKQQESMIADPEELDADTNLKESENRNKNKIKGVNDNGLDKIQEQTKILLDTHNELIKNIDSLKPYLKEANNFTKSISKIMNGSEPS